MTRNTAPAEGGPSGARLEVKIGAFYLLCLLAETEPRGMAGAVTTRVKFQRGYEDHALDDIVVEALNAAGELAALEIQAKRTLDFTASDAAFAKLVGQIVSATGAAAERPIAAAIHRTSAKIERHYQQLLILARKLGSGVALRRALDAPRVVSAGMRDFAAAFQAQLRAAGADADDEALWRVLRRFQILVFDFESPGAMSDLLALTLCQTVLPAAMRDRARDLWSALEAKALSYDADGGELDRAELVRWLREERGLETVASRNTVVARRRLADHSQATLDAIDDRIGAITLDRSARIDRLTGALEGARYLEIVGASGSGKSHLLKALAQELGPEAFPLVLSPVRTPGGGWLALSRDLGFEGSAAEFLTELSASGATILFVDSLDRVTDASVQATIADLLTAAARTPDVRVVVTVGPDFGPDQRQWLPNAALDLLGRTAVLIGPLSDAEVAELARADHRLAQLLANPAAHDLTRNLYQLRQLLRGAASDPTPLSEAALSRIWWEGGPPLPRAERRDRLGALRGLASQVLDQVQRLDINEVDSGVVEALIQGDDLVELVFGARAAFKHDVLRDWSAANLLREEPDRLEKLPLDQLAAVGLGRAVELYARMLIEDDVSGQAWSALVGRLRAADVHPSWLRLALLALVRSEQVPMVLDRAFEALNANQGELLRDLIRVTVAADSEPGAARLEAAGIARDLIPTDLRIPTGLSWWRLTGWLLARIDQLEAPVGRDILHFLMLWRMANFAVDPYQPKIVARLYAWLTELEGTADAQAVRSTMSRLFAPDGVRRRGHDLTQDVRTLFLMSCEKSPELAASYLDGKTSGRWSDDRAGDILKFGAGLAKAAPAAMAAYTLEVLVTADKRSRREEGGRDRLRLEFPPGDWTHPSPSQGPFLTLLRTEPQTGLRLIRQILDHGLGLDTVDRAALVGFVLELPRRSVRVIAPGTYLLSRSVGAQGVLTSMLRALEAWGHEQVEAGRPVLEVVGDILGDEEAPAALLCVAIDVLLSHIEGPDPALMPFVTCPEALKLDHDRFIQDSIGLNRPERDDSPAVPGVVTNMSLWSRRSRQTSLDSDICAFLIHGDAETLEQVRDRLRTEIERLPAPNDPGLPTHDLRWHAEHALRVLDPANWRGVLVPQPDGGTATHYQYVEPPEEAEVLTPLRASANANLAESALTSALVDAVFDAGKRTPELIAQGLAWAQAQPWETLEEDDRDFEQATRWRAVVAAAVLVNLGSPQSDALPWTRAVLTRALAVQRTERAYQARYDGLALAAVGWCAMATARDPDPLRRVFDLARRDASTVINTLGASLALLSQTDARWPRSVLRIGLAAAIHPERDYDNPKRTAGRKARRARRLVAVVRAEQAWLQGGAEPGWPKLPQARRFKKRTGIRIQGPGATPPDPAPFSEEIAPQQWFNEHSGGAWLTAVENSPTLRTAPWIGSLVDAYRDFSDNAWGLGLALDTELSELPVRWLHPYGALRWRVALALEGDGFEAAVLNPMLALPDQGFLDASEEVIGLLDRLFFDEKALGIDRLVLCRRRIAERLVACGDWCRGRDDRRDTIALDLAGPLQTLFFHQPTGFVQGACYLPSHAEAFAPTLPALVELICDAPGRTYVTGYFLALADRAQSWIPFDVVLSAAEAWIGARPGDASFWRDQGYGRRLCALMTDQMSRLRAEGPDIVERARNLTAALIAAGVPEAMPLEIHLAVPA